jgi:hypothetical protein
MKKSILSAFISKYNLAGEAESVKLVIKDKTLNCEFVTDSQNVVGSIQVNNFDAPDAELGVYATAQLIKLLSALEDEITMKVNAVDGKAFSVDLSDGKADVKFMLSSLDVIKKAPVLKNLPDWHLTLDMSKEFIDRFIRAKNALPESENFGIKAVENEIEVIINYSTINTNSIKFKITAPGVLPMPVICFSAKAFKEILNVNKESSTGKLHVSSKGLAKAEFADGDFASNYFLVQLQSVQ